MFNRIILYPYKIGSKSCRELSAEIKRKLDESGNTDVRVLRVRSSGRYRRRATDLVINWGSCTIPSWNYDGMVNRVDAVEGAVNKLSMFTILAEKGVRTVPFATSRDGTGGWETVVERRLLRAHGGRGIIMSRQGEVGNARLYTELLHPSEEYRVHVFNGRVIDYAKKAKRVDGGVVFSNDEKIKNKDSGWEFIRGVARRSGVQKRAIAAVEALGLDFGAVDILRFNNKSYVLEVNTACGLSPAGLSIYANQIIKLANGEHHGEDSVSTLDPWGELQQTEEGAGW